MGVFAPAVLCVCASIMADITISEGRRVVDPEHEPTALEVLERELLHQNSRLLRKRSVQHKRDENPKWWRSTDGPRSSSQQENGKHKVRLEGCYASFGANSPLCKTEREIRRSYRQIENPDWSTTLEDFFGLFTSSSSRRPSVKVGGGLPPGVVPVPSTPATEIGTTQSSPDRPETPTSTSDGSRVTRKKALLPGSLSKLEANSELLYLDRAGGMKQETNRFYKADEDGLEVSEEEHREPEPSAEQTTTEESDEFLLTDHPATPEWSILNGGGHVEETPPRKPAAVVHNADKEKCESESGKRCICSYKGITEDFHSIFFNAKSAKLLLEEIVQLRCTSYVPVPATFDLSSNAKPRVLSASKKPMPLDAEKGPKELPEKTLKDFLSHLTSDEDDVLRVFVNSDVKLSCFPTSDVHLSPSEADHVSYTWTHGNKEAITEGRIKENDDADGTLTIEEVSVSDTDNYTCEVSYIHPDTGQRTEEVFHHEVSVVTLPTVTVRVTVHYEASVTCDPGLLEMFELYLPQQVEEVMCHAGGKGKLCSVQLHSPVCHTKGSAESMEMSLNFEVYIHRGFERALPALNGTFCDPKCHLVISFRLLQLFKESMQDIVLTPVTSEVKGIRDTFVPQESSVHIRFVFGCIGGYRLEDGFCVACEKHHYSEDGWTECLTCPPHTYMGRLGARKCISCHKHWILYCNEFVESTNILLIGLVGASVITLVICLLTYYNVKIKGNKVGEVLQKLRSPGTKRRNPKLGRSQKRKQPRGKLQNLSEEEEMKKLMEESGVSDADDTQGTG